MRRFVILWVWCVACTAPSDPEPADVAPTRLPLVDHQVWEVVETSEGCQRVDVFGAPSFGYEVFADVPSFFVDTKLCSELTVTQPSRASIEAGDGLFVRVFHSQLIAEPPAEAHLTLSVDGMVLWETSIAMPAGAAVLNPEVVSEVDMPAGSAVTWHVRNHGANAYHLLELEVVR